MASAGATAGSHLSEDFFPPGVTSRRARAVTHRGDHGRNETGLGGDVRLAAAGRSGRPEGLGAPPAALPAAGARLCRSPPGPADTVPPGPLRRGSGGAAGGDAADGRLPEP